MPLIGMAEYEFEVTVFSKYVPRLLFPVSILNFNVRDLTSMLSFQIGLKEGLEMLNILKNYSEKTSILDDFNFYEKREKVLKAKRSSKPAIQPDVYEKADSLVSFSSLCIYINIQQLVPLCILA